ncbi:MAG: IPT/TIG domain-containing protein [Deltaproteobacteria bacterium]|nr:IPT/TIG domain-containing protein [Deltaproteobacteria bacterium]MDQ3297283.1 IPT/TIG domain-containing protein [Myxococcota bacterium]
MRNHIYILALVAAIGCGEVTDNVGKGDDPTITAIDPATGGIVGGVTITVTGTNFQSDGTPLVVVGGVLASDVMVTSDTQLTFTLPENDREGAVVDVTISTTDGFATKPGAFTYNVRPSVISIEPRIGRGVGGTPITIRGRGFQDAGTTTITIAGGMAANVTVVDDTTITATTAPVMMGTPAFEPLDVSFQNGDGDTTLQNAFAVTKPGLLALEGSSNGSQRIFHIDIASGVVKSIVSSELKIHGCATSPNGQVFATTGRRQAPQIHRLVRVDPLTGVVSVIGPLNDTAAVPLNHGVSTMTFVGNNLFGIDTEQPTGANRRLVSIDPATGTVGVIGAAAMNVQQISAIATRDATNVFVADRTNESLDSANTTNSVLTTGLAMVGGTGQPVKGLVNVGGTLYLSERQSPAAIYSIAQGANAALTRIATVPAVVVGLCETPSSF